MRNLNRNYSLMKQKRNAQSRFRTSLLVCSNVINEFTKIEFVFLVIASSLLLEELTLEAFMYSGML